MLQSTDNAMSTVAPAENSTGMTEIHRTYETCRPALKRHRPPRALRKRCLNNAATANRHGPISHRGSGMRMFPNEASIVIVVIIPDLRRVACLLVSHVRTHLDFITYSFRVQVPGFALSVPPHGHLSANYRGRKHLFK